MEMDEQHLARQLARIELRQELIVELLAAALPVSADMEQRCRRRQTLEQFHEAFGDADHLVAQWIIEAAVDNAALRGAIVEACGCELGSRDCAYVLGGLMASWTGVADGLALLRVRKGREGWRYRLRRV
jgi:hypothetical protein